MANVLFGHDGKKPFIVNILLKTSDVCISHRIKQHFYLPLYTSPSIFFITHIMIAPNGQSPQRSDNSFLQDRT